MDLLLLLSSRAMLPQFHQSRTHLTASLTYGSVAMSLPANSLAPHAICVAAQKFHFPRYGVLGQVVCIPPFDCEDPEGRIRIHRNISGYDMICVATRLHAGSSRSVMKDFCERSLCFEHFLSDVGPSTERSGGTLLSDLGLQAGLP